MRLINTEGKRRHVKHYLTSLRAMHESMRAKQDRLQRLRAHAEGLRCAMGESVSGGERRDLADVKQEIDDLADEYAADLARYSSELAEGYRICPVEDMPRHVCWMHWVEGKTWSSLARELGYDADHVRKKLCNRGVEGIYGDMPRRWRADAEDAEI